MPERFNPTPQIPNHREQIDVENIRTQISAQRRLYFCLCVRK